MSNSTPNTEDVREAQGWRPDPGDEIRGTIADVTAATSTQKDDKGNYPIYPLLLITKEDGEQVFLHCFHQTLQRAILERRPEIGHRIKVKFHGKSPLKSNPNRSVAIYSMVLPDTPKTAASVYDQLARNPMRRTAPQFDAPADVPIPPPEEDDDIDF